MKRCIAILTLVLTAALSTAEAPAAITVNTNITSFYVDLLEMGFSEDEAEQLTVEILLVSGDTAVDDKSGSTGLYQQNELEIYRQDELELIAIIALEHGRETAYKTLRKAGLNPSAAAGIVQEAEQVYIEREFE